MRVLVTGATGFIGGHTTRALVADGHSVAVVSRRSDPLTHLPNVADRIHVICADLRETSHLRRRVETFRPQVCVHLAWYAEPGQYWHSRENLTALFYSLELIRILADARCEAFIGAGTCAEYRADSRALHEDAPTAPTTLYAATKLACCHVGGELARRAGMRFTWARLFYPYGPGEDSRRLISAAIASLRRGKTFAASEGRQVRDYTHAADVGRALACLVTQGDSCVYNVASGTPVTVRQILGVIATQLNEPNLIALGRIPTHDWDPPVVCGDSSRLKKLGWSPEFDLEKGIADTIAWFDLQPVQ